MNAMLEMFRHKTWATLRLIEHCKGLEDEHLDATIPGTYGTIRETLRHIVESEEGYYSILTRERFLSKAAAAAFVRPADRLPEGPVTLDELAKRIKRLGSRWEVMAQETDLPSRDVVMVQTIHHASDHRSHIMSILGARGLELPGPNDLDAWGYAEARHLMQELTPK
jgi:uncharacterized damage-inducible protein DinB